MPSIGNATIHVQNNAGVNFRLHGNIATQHGMTQATYVVSPPTGGAITHTGSTVPATATGPITAAITGRGNNTYQSLRVTHTAANPRMQVQEQYTLIFRV